MSTARAGREREYRVRDKFVKAGWRAVMHAAASKGSADWLMAHPEHGAALIQVGTAAKYLAPAARARFITDAEMCGALPLVAISGPGGMRVYLATLDQPSRWEVYPIA